MNKKTGTFTVGAAILGIFCVGAILGAYNHPHLQKPALALSQSFEQLVADTSKGVVVIHSDSPAADPNKFVGGLGTGFFIDKNLIVTNAHVADAGKIITITLKNSSLEFDATLVAEDHMSDIALIRLNDWKRFEDQVGSYKILPFSKTDPMPGETVWSIGHPEELLYSVSKGVVSATGRLVWELSLIHISEPTRQAEISYAVFCLKK